ncbi:MAG TPA: TetR/AcrR family transcriptional regulator [Solirubrobacteraceae bacterium]|jgi:AcrR family transcriptional regulator|nr:TetR/AcrR family transcriptional regulator [Solirubrobacteraceae bacterium]
MAAARPILASRRAAQRREREREIVSATRLLFDERGLQDAPIEEIARAVGINKALIYRHFSSKEELFVLTITSYLADLAGRLAEIPEGLEPTAELEEGWRIYTGFCLEHPAFPDCGLSLMRRPVSELREAISDAVWIRLGQGMAACLDRLARILARGAAEGVFTVSDPDFTANHLYAQTLGTMHLARVGVGVRMGAAGFPEPFPIEPARVQETCIADVLASVGVRPQMS